MGPSAKTVARSQIDQGHCPHVSQMAVPPSSVHGMLGVHAGGAGHVHVPQLQVEPQVCVPYVLHGCDAS